jgi:hypothetical protein
MLTWAGKDLKSESGNSKSATLVLEDSLDGFVAIICASGYGNAALRLLIFETYNLVPRAFFVLAR